MAPPQEGDSDVYIRRTPPPTGGGEEDALQVEGGD